VSLLLCWCLFCCEPQLSLHLRMQFVNFENKDGARFSWNVLPTSRLDMLSLAVPVGCLYTPLKPINGLGTVKYRPILCGSQSCGAILNPYW